MTPSGRNSTSIGSVPDFEERFNPASRSIGESQLQDFDESKEKVSASKLIRLQFYKSIPAETKILLTDQLSSLLDFADEMGLRLRSTGHVFRFLDQSTYEEEVGSHLPKSVSLPASRLDFNSETLLYTVTVILPKNLETGEVIVNTIRTFFSKLFGSIYFEEQIRPLEFYQQNTSGGKEISAGVPEILALVKSSLFQSENLNMHCEEVAKAYRMSMKKQGEEIRKQLVDEWKQKWDARTLTSEEQHTIAMVFSEFQDAFTADSESILRSATEQVQKLNAQLHFILPHEQNNYSRFEQQKPSHYLRSVQNKIEEIVALAGYVEELMEVLENPDEDTDFVALGSEIRKRMRQMRKERKVVLFYVPDMPLNEDLLHLKSRFPLRLVKMLPPGTPMQKWSKEIKRMEKHYANSIYSKLYTALHSLGMWAESKVRFTEAAFQKSADADRLHQMKQIFKFRLPLLMEMQNSLGIILDTCEIRENQEEKQLIPLDDFRKAWGYFIAFILTLNYYQNPVEAAALPHGFRSDHYLKSIMRFINQQCSKGINSFHIVQLLWLIYERKAENGEAEKTASEEMSGLEFLLYSLNNPQAVIRFTMHRVMRPETERATIEQRLQKLPNFRDAWIAAFQNQLE